MELILLQKVTNLGNLGDKVNVKPGFGRNYLVPQGKAVPATAANLAEFEAKRAEYEAKASDALATAEARKARLEGAVVTIHANASTEGKLYGSVGPREIAEAITNAVKHAEASVIRVTVTAGDVLALSVADDGRGGAVFDGSGLVGLRDRVEALRGRLRVVSPRGTGTTVSAELPL